MNDCKVPVQDKDTPVITKKMVEEGQKIMDFLKATVFGGDNKKT